MIRTNWIGKDMYMEIYLDKDHCITTSRVIEAIVQGDNWEYSLWQD